MQLLLVRMITYILTPVLTGAAVSFAGFGVSFHDGQLVIDVNTAIGLLAASLAGGGAANLGILKKWGITK